MPGETGFTDELSLEHGGTGGSGLENQVLNDDHIPIRSRKRKSADESSSKDDDTGEFLGSDSESQEGSQDQAEGEDSEMTNTRQRGSAGNGSGNEMLDDELGHEGNSQLELYQQVQSPEEETGEERTKRRRREDEPPRPQNKPEDEAAEKAQEELQSDPEVSAGEREASLRFNRREYGMKYTRKLQEENKLRETDPEAYWEAQRDKYEERITRRDIQRGKAERLRAKYEDKARLACLGGDEKEKTERLRDQWDTKKRKAEEYIASWTFKKDIAERERASYQARRERKTEGELKDRMASARAIEVEDLPHRENNVQVNQAQHDPIYQNSSVYDGPYFADEQYGMQSMLSSMYDPNAQMPPTEQQPQGATNVDPLQWIQPQTNPNGLPDPMAIYFGTPASGPHEIAPEERDAWVVAATGLGLIDQDT